MMNDFPGADQVFQALVLSPQRGPNSILHRKSDTNDVIEDLLRRDWSGSLGSYSDETVLPENEPPLLVRDGFFSPISLTKQFTQNRSSLSLYSITSNSSSAKASLETPPQEDFLRKEKTGHTPSYPTMKGSDIATVRPSSSISSKLKLSKYPQNKLRGGVTPSTMGSAMCAKSNIVDKEDACEALSYSADDVSFPETKKSKVIRCSSNSISNAEEPGVLNLAVVRSDKERKLSLGGQVHTTIDRNDVSNKAPRRPQNNKSSRNFVRWTPEEDEILKHAIENEKQGNNIPWKKISVVYFRESRNGNQCRGRWKKSLMPGLNQGAWTEKEDERLKQLQADGLVWSKIAKQMPGRTSEHVRDRFTNVLDPLLRKDPFTEDERTIVFDAQRRLGNKWTEIAKLLPGRSESMVKNFWHNSKMVQRRAIRRAARKGLKQKGQKQKK